MLKFFAYLCVFAWRRSTTLIILGPYFVLVPVVLAKSTHSLVCANLIIKIPKASAAAFGGGERNKDNAMSPH